MELIKHKHAFASYMQRVDVMCKEEANQGQYAVAWLDVKKKWDLEDSEEMGGGDGSKSSLSGLTVDSASHRPVATELTSSWPKEYIVEEVQHSKKKTTTKASVVF